jgi:hypothetical protein
MPITLTTAHLAFEHLFQPRRLGDSWSSLVLLSHRVLPGTQDLLETISPRDPNIEQVQEVQDTGDTSMKIEPASLQDRHINVQATLARIIKIIPVNPNAIKLDRDTILKPP